MTVPIKYPVQSRGIPSFEFTDFLTGLGYKTFYPTGAIATTSDDDFLSSVADVASSAGNLNEGTSGTTRTFEATFNVPIIVAGADAIAVFTTQHGANTTVTEVFTIWHVRGAVATSLGTQTSSEASGGSVDSFRRCQRIALTRKKFAIGDILRVTIAHTWAGASGVIWFDPASRKQLAESTTGVNIGTDIKVMIPFEVRA